MTELQHTSYYPFGGIIADTLLTKGRDVQNRMYNGKELDTSNNLWWYDYVTRPYDPTPPRFTTPDPLAEKYYPWNYYTYCVNNPVKNIDPDGRVIIPVHGTWSKTTTWEDLQGIKQACNNLFNDDNLGESFRWSGGNYRIYRTEAAAELITNIRAQLKKYGSGEPITLVGHSHGGNVIIEAVNMMAEIEEFNDIQINILTINTPVREDYQLTDEAQSRVDHVNVYDEKDPVQIRGGDFMRILPENRSTLKFTGEYGEAGRTFKNAYNIKVDHPQGIGIDHWIHVKGWEFGGLPVFGDFHNSHNRVKDWIRKTKRR